MAVGVNLEGLRYAPEAEAEAELQQAVEPVIELKPGLAAEAQPETVPAIEPAPEPQPKPVLPLHRREAKRTNALRYCPKAAESSTFGDWDYKDWETKREKLSAIGDRAISGLGEEKADGGDSLTGFSAGFDMLTTGDANYIEISPGTIINTNTIWDSNVLLLGCVEVNNAMLIIKPGVEVKISPYYEDGSIIVRNNGCLIANGTPDRMICFSPTYWFPYSGYGCAIKLEETASPLCEISYCQIYCAEIGILSLNNRLENPIHDNSIWDCIIGIAQDGPMLTDVVNNEILAHAP